MPRPKIYDNPGERIKAYREDGRIEIVVEKEFKEHLRRLATEGNMSLNEYIKGILDYHTGFYRREL